MPLGIGIEQIASARDRHFLADAGDDVLQRPAVGRVIMDVVGGEDGAAVPARQPVEPLCLCLEPGVKGLEAQLERSPGSEPRMNSRVSLSATGANPVFIA